MFTKDEVIKAIRDQRVIFYKSAVEALPTWDDFYSIYKKALMIRTEQYGGFGTLTVDNSEGLSEVFDQILEDVSDIHPGNKIAVLSIVHFLNAHDNTIPDEAVDFSKDFFNNNPDKMPSGFDISLFKPTRHSDPVDGFFIQCNGQTTWRVFYRDSIEEYLASPGDMLFIPKGIEHSVESMNVRNAISISFFDEG